MNPVWAQPLGWALAHSLWQITVLALLYRVARPFLAARPRLRYGAGLTLLTTALVVVAATLVAQRPPDPGVSHEPGLHTSHSEAAGSRVDATLSLAGGNQSAPEWVAAFLDPHLESGVALWLLGLAAAGFGLTLAHEHSRELVKGASPASSPALLEAVEHCRSELEVRSGVGVAVSADVDSPILIGWLRPVIIVPEALERKLGPLRLESLVAHELAHVKRRDYPVNLLQTVIEKVFFFHPAARWLSREVRIAREHCCDDLAASASRGGALGYARSLARIEECRATPAIALGVGDGDLYRRIRRLLPAESAPEGSRAIAQRAARVAAVATRLALAGLLLLAGLRIADASASATTILDGLDPVLLLEGEQVAGSAGYSLVSGGYRYRFSGRETYEAFRRDPARYSARNVRACPITGRGVRPDVWRVVDGQILLFCCDSAPEPLVREAARALTASLES